MSRALPEFIEVDLGLDLADDESALRREVARRLGGSATLARIEVRKRSIDARRGRVRFHYTVQLFGDDRGSTPEILPELPVTKPSQIVIVGDGPAGMFCAYELARHGLAATVVERGKPVQPRRRDLKLLNQQGRVDADSNYCFGEGGAGTYSDGKLYTRAHKRGDVRDILRILVAHGAPADILIDGRPHIGSNRLPKVVDALRMSLESVGVRFLFEHRVTDVRVEERTGARVVTGVAIGTSGVLDASDVVVATGHSARDVYTWLARAGAPLEQKPFAVGVRVEHPQVWLNQLQYGKSAGHPKLPAAAYQLARTEGTERVFSFCMCPGGWIVPAATEEGLLVVNGMSLSRRDSPFANSGFVTGIDAEDTAQFQGTANAKGAANDETGMDALVGLRFQERLERAAFDAGGGALRAPAQRVTDFLRGRLSATLPDTSYIPGITSGDLHAVLRAAGPDLGARLSRALRDFDRKLAGFISEEAVLVGVETRTSSPLRVLRDPVTLESPRLERLFPCGEGAGYAGGIMSAAMDGIRVARRIALLHGRRPAAGSDAAEGASADPKAEDT